MGTKQGKPVKEEGAKKQGSQRNQDIPSREEFARDAKPVLVRIGESPLPAGVKEFSTGSYGWYANGKSLIEVGGRQVWVQAQVTLTVIGSKELPQD